MNESAPESVTGHLGVELMDIRHIAVSESTPVFAVGAFEHDVTVWDYAQRRKAAELKTILDFGGERLAIYNRDPSLLIAGAYNRYGICAYDLRTPGEKAWWRRDLKNPQIISVSERLGLMFSSFGYTAPQLLNVATGESIRRFRKAFKCYFGPLDDEIILAESFGDVWSASIRSGVTICRFPVQNGAIDVAQSQYAVLIADYGETDDSAEPITQVAPARLLCYSRDATLLWQADAAYLAHFLRTAWCPELSLWFAVEWPYVYGGPTKLKAFTPEGKLTYEAIIGDVSETEFFLQGQCLITSNGEVLELPSLNVLWRFRE